MIKVLENPWVRVGIFIAVLVLLCFSAYALSFVLVPLLLAFLVAYVLDPVVDWFEARRVSRSVAIMALAMLGLGLVLSVPLIAVPSLIDQAERFSARAQKVSQQDNSSEISHWIDWATDALPLERILESTGWREQYEAHFATVDVTEDNAVTPPSSEDTPETPEDGSQPPEAEEESPDADTQERSEIGVAKASAVIAWKIGETVRSNLMNWVRDYGGTAAATGKTAGASLASFLSSIGSGVAEVVVFFGNLAVFSFVGGFLLRDYDYVVAEIGKLVPPKWRENVFRIMGKIDVQLRNFLVGQGTVCAALALMYWIGLWLAGVPFAGAIALFGGFATLIPFFGVVLTFVPSFAFSLMYHGVGMNLVWVVAVFIIVQALEGNVVTPFIMGQRVGLHPVWVILAVIVFGSLLGFTGLLIAVPLAAVLKVLVVEGVDAYKASALFEEERAAPEPEPKPEPATE